jgi:hypothetical protein
VGAVGPEPEAVAQRPVAALAAEIPKPQHRVDAGQPARLRRVQLRAELAVAAAQRPVVALAGERRQWAIGSWAREFTSSPEDIAAWPSNLTTTSF